MQRDTGSILSRAKIIDNFPPLCSSLLVHVELWANRDCIHDFSIVSGMDLTKQREIIAGGPCVSLISSVV